MPTPATASATSLVTTATATMLAAQSAGGTAPVARDLAASGESTMPSPVMLGSTAGILVAFAVSVGFLIRERRLHREELEERELDHWRSYR
ncbi:MAG: hypothetical protein IRY85_21595 [Micromonosporaceae bacterium]|nr:hypothetical protein [Micromonosporaceae bacterium]